MLSKTERSTGTNTDRSALVRFLASHPRTVVLTGAGISTSSGIPTYRDEAGDWLRGDPILHQAFVSSLQTRQRYWLRSLAGWPVIDQAKPGPAHVALAALEQRGVVEQVVTQNIDRLHQKAGSRKVTDLHGRLDRVICMNCHGLISRVEMQDRLAEQNPDFAQQGTAAPDGDADIDEALVDQFQVPPCPTCGGHLKPDVVFFGGSVARQLVQRVFESISAADALLVIGSSLKVYSGFRFCRHAHATGIPIASINPGRTRADALLSLQVWNTADAILGDIDAHF